MDVKCCTKCKTEKTLPEFTKRSSAKDGYGSWCKKCMCEHNKTRYQDNAHVRLAKKTYDSHNRPAYIRHHLTKTEFEELLEKSNKVCPICKIKEASVVDHDHACCPGSYSCGLCVRGLLCITCNMMIGLANDNIETLKSSIKYLTH